MAQKQLVLRDRSTEFRPQNTPPKESQQVDNHLQCDRSRNSVYVHCKICYCYAKGTVIGHPDEIWIVIRCHNQAINFEICYPPLFGIGVVVLGWAHFFWVGTGDRMTRDTTTPREKRQYGRRGQIAPLNGYMDLHFGVCNQFPSGPVHDALFLALFRSARLLSPRGRMDSSGSV